MTNITDPKEVGGTYFCGYWREKYTILAMWDNNGNTLTKSNGYPWMTVKWDRGNITTHCTPWDAQRDKVVETP